MTAQSLGVLTHCDPEQVPRHTVPSKLTHPRVPLAWLEVTPASKLSVHGTSAIPKAIVSQPTVHGHPVLRPPLITEAPRTMPTASTRWTVLLSPHARVTCGLPLPGPRETPAGAAPVYISL